MSILAIGLNHESAPLELRSRFAFGLDQLAPTLRGFRIAGAFGPAHPEAALLSTCNRTELYCAGGAGLGEAGIQWLANLGGVDRETLLRHAYVLNGAAAVRHAFRVASGLDSMVLGETQILGQMKRAVREAEAAGTLGATLHQMFQHSFSGAKEVRTRTEIGAHSISLAAASVRLAAETFADLERVRVLFVGAGEMIERVAAHFAAKLPRTMAVANRGRARGERLAGRFGAELLRLSELARRLADFDVIVSCTASPAPVIGLRAVEDAMQRRSGRPMLFIDLAVPRDVEPGVARLDNVFLHAIDDLAVWVQAAGAKRQAAVEQAEALVDAGVRRFLHWLDRRAAVPLMQALNARTEDWQKAELLRARRRLARGENVEAVLEALSKGLAQKMLHGARAELLASAGEDRRRLASTVSRLFLRCPVRNPLFESMPGDGKDIAELAVQVLNSSDPSSMPAA